MNVDSLQDVIDWHTKMLDIAVQGRDQCIEFKAVVSSRKAEKYSEQAKFHANILAVLKAHVAPVEAPPEPANVILFPGVTTLDMNPDRVLKGAVGQVKELVIAAFDKEGEYYFATNLADSKTVLWLLKQCEKRILTAGEDE